MDRDSGKEYNWIETEMVAGSMDGNKGKRGDNRWNKRLTVRQRCWHSRDDVRLVRKAFPDFSR